jgi:hypothetical protein
MTATVTRDRSTFADLSAVFARGYLRLTAKRRHPAVSRRGEPRISLDVLRTESPHVDGHDRHGRP